MRAVLVFVILILLGLLGGTWHFKTRPTEAHRQIIAKLKEDLGKALEEQSRLREDLARTQAELARRGGASIVPKPPVPATPVASNPGRPAAQGSLDQRLAELKTIYDRNLAAIEKERSEAERILAETTAQRRQLANTELKFTEQHSVTDEEGNVVGSRGIRTSEADRDRAHKLRQRKLDEFDAKIKKASETISGIDQRRALLDEQYRNALEKAQADSTGSGR